MVEGAGAGVELLDRAVTTLLAERPIDLPAPVALDRCAALLVARERLDAAALAAVGDMDRRELFALDAAGSARSWLRQQVCGDGGQLTRARQLADREQVWLAQAMGEVSGKAAGQVCSALEKVPAEVPEDRLESLLVDGLVQVLGPQLGRGLPDGREPSADQLALRAELASIVGDALNDTAASADVRLEPVLLLLARQVAPGALQDTLSYLLDGLLPDRLTPPDPTGYYLDLIPVLDGDWDLRGHLDHETGVLLKAELDRRARLREKAHAEAVRQAEAEAAAMAEAAAEADARQSAAGAASPVPDETDPFGGLPQPHPVRDDRLSKGRLRHDDLKQALTDAADRDAGTGQSAPVAITVIASLDAVEGKAGALPGLMEQPGRQPVKVSSQALQRMGCYSELTAVLVDALGRPVGVSSSHRSADKRERAALRAVWGWWCAVAGCTRTKTVPHHVEPWWLSRQTILKHLIPLCDGCHHDVHDDHRTLRLKDGRLINEVGWA